MAFYILKGGENMIIYVVKKGDTLISIAKKYGKTLESIVSENMINIDDTLVIGQTIVITQNDTKKIGSIAINGYLYTNINRKTLKMTLPYLTFVTVFTYGFTDMGELIIPDDEEIISLAKSAGVAPIMLISTLSKDGVFNNELSSILLNDVYMQDTLIDNILENIENKGYFGLDIDFEYVLPEEREAYVSFIDKITKNLNKKGYPVIVSLAPKTSNLQQGVLYEAHDYKNIGSNANAVLLMTYEWGYTYGPPMAVSPINKVENVLKYAVTQIPPNKIFMGIPNYGYDWRLPYEKGKSKARSLSNVDAVSLARKNGAIILFDKEAMSPYFTYIDENGSKHIVYFEDARSIEAKLRLANSYNFTGISYWNIMKYFPQSWLVAKQLFDIQKVRSL